ncbi:MAG: PSD1 and planctomycete cytochrome C domain-containing protein [Chthoniobacter sp.]|uniref:PSD1 and planctomycete cytochrome C domain-containing protein n=1 Tax=Chthoniobacter sp. TaxID=2510640 RepID=UPI0032A97A68
MTRLASLATFALVCAVVPGAVAITPQETEFFEKQVRPVLVEQCYKCHGPDKQKGALRMDSRAAILKGTDDGPIVVPGKPGDSELIKSIKHIGDSKMPEKADKLPDAQIAALEQWVKMGMPWPENDGPAKPSASMEVAKTHWSLQPIKNPAPPPVKDAQHWGQSPVDQFILAKLEEKNIAPSPRAAKRTLLRRATFDLTGLPPTTAEMDAFEKDNAPDAFAKVVDRLLASPHYGERWGRYWLDVARYADTKGYLAGGEERRYSFSYTYRDWVIRAFNEDLPYDQFVIQQLAGDRVSTPADPRPMAALGFLTLGRRFLNSQPDIIDDRIDVVCRGFMGLTVACARCHDHKFDPILQKDYYALYGVFASSVEPSWKDLPILPSNADPANEVEYRKQLGDLEGQLGKFIDTQRQIFAMRTFATLGVPAIIPPEVQEKLLDKQGKQDSVKLRNKIDELNGGPLAPPRPQGMVDAPVPMTPHVFIRGNPGRPGDVVPRRFLQVLSGGDPQPFKDGSGRLELGKAIASKDNPLTARVFVNRVWNLHFGAGLVRTPGDFGTKGEPPTHPELLDYLATRFMSEGWSVKKLHRAIMLSSAYQQSSDLRTDAAQADPENRLVWHMNRRRLDFEAMRDSLLAVAGQLDSTMGGRPVEITAAPYAKRRAVYGLIDRQNLPGVFHTFDFATPDQTSPQRHVTTVPQQALFMMNNPFVIQQAQALVAKPEFQQPQAYEAQVHELYECVYARKAASSEVDAGLRFVMNAITNPHPREEGKSAWQYGWGAYDEAAHRVDFHKLPFFSGKAWQGSAKVPDATLGYVTINADGGHAGSDHAHNTIRRWTAPDDGVVSITGPVQRPSDHGDGIVARVVSSRLGELFKSDVLPAATVEVKLDKVEVKKGDTIDFLVDLRGNLDSDGFVWHPLIKGSAEWDAKTQFAGPPPTQPKDLTPWEQYAQVLLETNEFVFVD